LCCSDVLEQWVGDYYGYSTTAVHPLLPITRWTLRNSSRPTLMAGTASQRKIGGEYINDYSEVKAMVQPELEQPKGGLDFDRDFRRGFTRWNGGARAEGIIPEGGRIVPLFFGPRHPPVRPS
jgi:hypothetical protein